jgi:hypothetical protein
LIQIADEMDLSYEPEFIMQDAQAAARSAAVNAFPDVKILMCYFHLKKNVKENCKHLMENESYSELQIDLK